eukprot:1201246-Rhodomonas_salina.1
MESADRWLGPGNVARVLVKMLDGISEEEIGDDAHLWFRSVLSASPLHSNLAGMAQHCFDSLRISGRFREL